jgi:phytoene dehydrogenase-like protein
MDINTRATNAPVIDKVTLEILANHTRAAAENMAYTLYRTAHSTFVKETEDFTVQILDASGLTVAVPLDLGATWYPGLDYGKAIDMIEGGYVEGAHLASQLGRFRPIPELAGYKTILPNLYNCSANVHAGSGIGRGSSYNAWKQIAADLGIDPDAVVREPTE